MPDHNRDLAKLLDLLIPGDGRWPSASAAGVTIADIEPDLDGETVDWVMSIAAATAPELAALERREADRFRRMLMSVHRAYYTTPAVRKNRHGTCKMPDRESPRRISTPSLVATVIATQAARRRL